MLPSAPQGGAVLGQSPPDPFLTPRRGRVRALGKRKSGRGQAEGCGLAFQVLRTSGDIQRLRTTSTSKCARLTLTPFVLLGMSLPSLALTFLIRKRQALGWGSIAQPGLITAPGMLTHHGISVAESDKAPLCLEASPCGKGTVLSCLMQHFSNVHKHRSLFH